MNIERFILFLEEYNNCLVKHYYYFTGEREEHVFLLEDNTEIVVKEPK